jgi:hypothetical protein
VGNLSYVALLCEYFVAPDDAAAASTIDWIGGPDKPPKPRGFLKRSSQTAYPTVSLPGVEPVVMMGKLDGLLTGRSFDDVLADPTGHQVAIRDGGERLVWALPTALQDALLASDDARLRAMAVPWVATEEFWGQGDPVAAGEWLVQLRQLVRDGKEHGRRLYCWVCV